ncbi:MAG TPA: histidine kinase [Holophagaceae bacterium]|nr:histidine kinase [Holophagaceae bacterium]
MQHIELLRSLKPRLQPNRWGFLAVFLLLLAFVRIVLGDAPSPQEWPHFLRGFLLILGMVVLAPMPWQWTGDARRMAPLWRGFLQSLLWNALWLGLLLHLYGTSHRFSVITLPPPRDPALMAFLRHLHQQSGLPTFALPLVGLAPVSMLLGWIIATLQAAEADRAEAVTARHALEATARQAQEQALKAQLDPHVLYNALSGISELIHEDPHRAEEAVVSLGELYRKLTVFGARESVPLDEERALVTDYLAVEQVRLGPRLKVAWDWPAALGRREVPPLLLQPLVENALKHGLALRKQGGTVSIAVAEEGRGLRFTVANDGEPLDPDWRAGTGLSNLAARLRLLGEGSRVALRCDGGRTLAELHLRPGEAP